MHVWIWYQNSPGKSTPNSDIKCPRRYSHSYIFFTKHYNRRRGFHRGGLFLLFRCRCWVAFLVQGSPWRESRVLAHLVSDDTERFLKNVTSITIYSMYVCRWLNHSSMSFGFVRPKCLDFQSISIPKIRLIRLELHNPGSEYPATVAEVLCEDCLGPRPRQRRPEGFATAHML